MGRSQQMFPFNVEHMSVVRNTQMISGSIASTTDQLANSGLINSCQVCITQQNSYVWDAQAKLGCIMTPSEQKLSERMQTMWANFAKCLDPTCGGGSWPKYANSTRKALVLQTPADEIEED